MPNPAPCDATDASRAMNADEKYERALALALEIRHMFGLGPADTGYAARLARALNDSLIDELASLARSAAPQPTRA